MAVKYIGVPHKIPSKPDQPVMYYPRLKSRGDVDLRQIANDIAMGSTMSRADTIGVVESLLETIPRYLAEGYIVRLGELGSFSLSIQAEGSDRPENVRASKIKKNKVNFRAGKLLRQMLKHIKYERDRTVPRKAPKRKL
jgi:predicted histone-like DNA-binding protein